MDLFSKYQKQIQEDPVAAQHVDESQYSLDEWCEALVEFSAWEIREGRSLEFADKMEYLSCCAQGSVQSGKLVSLVTLLETYLREHGVH